jgi:predicted nuclease of predicted toxin-antitoxin system
MKKYKWRIYADNNMEREIVEHLREHADMDILWVRDHPELARERDDTFHYQKASEMQRYLLTHDDDFLNDSQFPLQRSPGVIVIPENAESMAKYFPQLLRKLMRDYNIKDEALYLDGIKIKLTWEGIMIKMIDHDSQKKTADTWTWKDLGYKV